MAEEIKDIEKFESRNLPDTTPVIIPQRQDPNAMIQMALSYGQDLEKLERVLALQIKYEENEAKKAFYAAVADFKMNPPEVLKDKENTQFSKGDRKAMYASLGSFVKSVNPALGKHGLSASWEITQAEKIVKVTCKLSHRLGHSESVTMEAPPDTSGGNAKNPIQQIKSTITYLRSVTFESVTGTAATDANLDDDGNAAGEPIAFINDKQLGQIVDMINAKNVDETVFLSYMKVGSAEEIKQVDFKKAMAALNKAKGRDREPGGEG